MIPATLHQLKVFETVARHGSFTRAAEELSITQPTVSSQVKQLTKAVGLPLFEQIGKSLYLTDAGTELLSTCQDVFERLTNFQMTVADLKGMKQGQLKLAVITTAKYFIPRLLGSFCQKYPGIDVTLKVTNHKTIQQRILNNEDDLYIVSNPPQEIDLYSQSFLDNPLVVVANKKHHLAGKSMVAISELDGEPFIMREQGSGTREAVLKLFNQHDISVRVRLELGSNEAIKQAIAGGLGISVLSEHCLISEGKSGELTILDIEGFPIERRWYVSYIAGKKLSTIAKTFLDYLLEESPKVTFPASSILTASVK
ncbi:transcriptional regulator [Xenococcus sp. PCC 7305]|uniref:LysR family transcriptional regulator n=1 Tax=Xenococcus sp. PCC 7305 TaxID=102125 RepID=UPI0002ACC13D|nr:LysR family transcriptional regulator [Xenococcus sp. PCC 7305]ELS03012.1 transcriptional regulator [Xenococcus sp. PCC 7305]